MPKKSMRAIRKQSELEYQALVEQVADRVWQIIKKNARFDRERIGITTRGGTYER
jgi:hypothetical protein